MLKKLWKSKLFYSSILMLSVFAISTPFLASCSNNENATNKSPVGSSSNSKINSLSSFINEQDDTLRVVIVGENLSRRLDEYSFHIKENNLIKQLSFYISEESSNSKVTFIFKYYEAYKNTNVRFNAFYNFQSFYSTDLIYPSYKNQPKIFINGNFVFNEFGTLIKSNSNQNEINVPEKIKIPNTNNYITISSIGANCFPENVKKVILPNSIRIIGRDGFYSCKNLELIDLPENLMIIDDYAFYYCTKMIRVNFNHNLRVIGSYAFNECGSLIGATIPNNVQLIGEGAFKACNNFSYVILPNSLRVINEKTFSSCSSLNKIVFSKNLSIIEDFAFDYCYNLTSLQFPETLFIISDYAFNNCSSISYVKTYENLKYINEGAFSGCIKLERAVISNKTTYKENSFPSKTTIIKY